jgi:hypothetical protein
MEVHGNLLKYGIIDHYRAGQKNAALDDQEQRDGVVSGITPGPTSAITS